MTRLAFNDTGTDLPGLVLLHAFPLNRAMWAPQIPELGRRFRLVRPDAFGFGATWSGRKSPTGP
jgi:pimeloyl-ACP methyl ester carboxylesterase